MQSKIHRLTPEQEELAKLQRQKWQQLVLLTKRIDRQKAIQTMKSLYSLIEQEEPKFVFADSPYMALKTSNATQPHLGRKIEKKLRKPLQDEIESQLSCELIQDLYSRLRPDLIVLEGQLKFHVDEILKFRKFIPATYWLDTAILLDVGASVLDCRFDQHKRGMIQAILENCGWILPYSETCIICDRPTKILFSLFDDENYLHAEKEPAIQFADGFSVWVHHEDATAC